MWPWAWRAWKRPPIFYEGTLGFKPVRLEPGRAVYETGRLTIYGVEGEPHPPVPSFTVEDLD